MIRVKIPPHLRILAKVQGELALDVPPPVTQRRILDALEDQYPMLKGTIRDHTTQKRRAMIRFFACEADYSDDDPDAPVPDAVANGTDPFLIVGAIAGG